MSPTIAPKIIAKMGGSVAMKKKISASKKKRFILNF